MVFKDHCFCLVERSWQRSRRPIRGILQLSGGQRVALELQGIGHQDRSTVDA